MGVRLRHLHLPSVHPHYIPYSLASRVQEHFRRQHLDFKDAKPGLSPAPAPPPPTLISFTPAPIFTLGRRQTTPLSPSETARLTAPLRIPAPPPPTPPPHNDRNSNSNNNPDAISLTPKVLHAPRGGLTTYHGPGQVVLWPVLDLRPRAHHHRPPPHRSFTVKCYARLLEETTIAALAAAYGLAGRTTADPGVWVAMRSAPRSPRDTNADADADADDGEQSLAKIAALGVHLRRHVSALGTAVNLAFPPPYTAAAADETTNPWARIVACGLEGRAVTSVAGELGEGAAAEMDARLARAMTAAGQERERCWPSSREGRLATVWAAELARRMGIAGGVEGVGGEEVMGLMEELVRGIDAGSGDGNRDEMAALEEERTYLSRMRDIFAGR
ncbi:uncharacterized protein THITE_2170030 [Thermothielavioides terrestris NRRL 8126]|uniref:BPL/LPL catalytic domain-containing protein n=1 Tax=Thermothielavioides terrestris (strain ATCC 38088 / NRRL 8126) TaxID=578455 RepID=G2R0E3_THETT|nr:uncharacterized protein THITE_2170030 [Thermothielavioides terrestris NRRL 8126]AEO65608.1 hypothetical protein THITE_2170030 [Thermothielavioides terrestris NRRL 8126]